MCESAQIKCQSPTANIPPPPPPGVPRCFTINLVDINEGYTLHKLSNKISFKSQAVQAQASHNYAVTIPTHGCPSSHLRLLPTSTPYCSFPPSFCLISLPPPSSAPTPTSSYHKLKTLLCAQGNLSPHICQ